MIIKENHTAVKTKKCADCEEIVYGKKILCSTCLLDRKRVQQSKYYKLKGSKKYEKRIYMGHLNQ